MIRSSWAITALLCAGAAAQPPQASPWTYRIAGVTAPYVIEKQAPPYSEDARVAKLQGTVLISLLVGEDGQPRNLRVLKSLGLGLDENAVASVSRWRFAPGTKDGQPVAVPSTVEVNFRLMQDARSWHLEGAAFNVPQGATQPRLIQAPYPPPSGLEQTGAVRLSFDVDEQGVPRNIHVESSSDPQWEDDVTVLIREWRFVASLKDGIPMAAHGYLDFGRGDLLPRTTSAPVFRKRM
jgi:TonB family protein